MFSGGIGSWAAAKRVVVEHGAVDTVLLFSDTLIEDGDLYRFLGDAAANVGAPLVRLVEGRTPWQVFFDERFLGNSRIDPCSRILKRQIVDRWLKDNCDPAQTVCYVGIDWTEQHRFDNGEGRGLRPRRAAQGWRYEAPMLAPPYLTKRAMVQWAESEGLTSPRLYGMGFSHNNCGGFCCKAGQGHFARLLATMPRRYAEHEAQEEAIRVHLNADVSMMTDRSGNGAKKPLTMRMLRERIERGGQIDHFEIGACGCFLDEPNDPDLTQRRQQAGE
jgi:hypothetical protein